jgi:two-component system cell cycle response regulator
MARLSDQRKSGKRILLVDDQEDYLFSTKALIEREGHGVLCASSGEEGLAIAREERVDLILLDYYMPKGMTGEIFVAELRKFNSYTQIILQTGYAGDYPPREILKRLDIQGYHDKADGPDKLMLWVDVGLKAAFMVQMLNKNRQGLRYILDVTPDLNKIQPVEDLLQGILLQISGLLGVMNSFVALLPLSDRKIGGSEGFVALVEEESELQIRVATGKFVDRPKMDDCLEPSIRTAIRDSLNARKAQISGTGTVIPLWVGDIVLGVIYLDEGVGSDEDIELLNIFANQAAVSIHNSQLYAMATIDKLTGTYMRRFFEQWLLRELRTAFRIRQPLCLLMIDMDGLKAINDGDGHLCGDQALGKLGRVLMRATRASDIVARYGGDEFAVILPQTPTENVGVVVRRIREMLAEQSVPGKAGPIAIGCSIGASNVEINAFDQEDIPRPLPQGYYESMAKEMVLCADKMLYAAKGVKGSGELRSETVPWPSFEAKRPAGA